MMSRAILLFCWCCLTAATTLAEPAIQLHPENPHYFLFRGKPTILVTSGEHYGAVLNLDFDYVPYLDELKKHQFNLTRVFSGAYREVPGSFNIVGNTLAPGPGRFICPWTEIVGSQAANRKFDLDAWNEAYFDRLKDFVRQASARGVVVEVVLFCTMYDDNVWNASPMNARNNVDQAGDVSKYEVYTGKDERLMAVQQKLAAKIAAELNDFDNVYFEICNEPYERGGLTKEWNDAIVAAVVRAEAALPNKHLIAQGFPASAIAELNPLVSVLNFHAARPESVAKNYHLNRVIADDETGGSDRSHRKYRAEGWEFLLAGGGVYDHLDFSFTTDSEAGTAVPLPDGTPGGGGPVLRSQLAILKKFVESFDLIHMKPSDGIIKNVIIQPAEEKPATSPPTVHVLANPGKAYAIYVNGGRQAELSVELPKDAYIAEWINTKTGTTERSERILAMEGATTLRSPEYLDDIAVALRRAN